MNFGRAKMQRIIKTIIILFLKNQRLKNHWRIVTTAYIKFKYEFYIIYNSLYYNHKYKTILIY